MTEELLYLGFDLSPEYSQLSCYNIETGEPESIYHNASKDTYLLPNIMFYSEAEGTEKSAGGWYVGTTASSMRFKEDGIIVDRVYQSVLMNEQIQVMGKKYKAKDLLVKLMSLHIKEFTDRFEAYKIERLVVSVADTDAYIIKAVRELQKELKLTDEQFEVVSHIDSGLYYIFNQPETLRNNSVALFDFGGRGLDYYRVDITRNKHPELVNVVHQDLHKKMSYGGYRKDRDELDDDFAGICKEALAEVYISSVFLTGIGFADDWLKESAAVLCQGRRVFVGQNIYTKGACYRAYGRERKQALGRYFIQTEHTVKADIGINLKDEHDTFVPIIQGGGEWFHTKGRIYIFLDDTNRIELVYRNIITGDVVRENIEIHGLPKRPPKTTKISLEVELYDDKRGAVVLRDEGFGTLYPSTNKIYRKEFELEWEK